MAKLTSVAKSRSRARTSRPKSRASLARQLSRLDGLFAEKRPRVAQSLRRPAAARTRDRLAKHFGGKLPSDIAAWFAWHDGQDGGDSLAADGNWRAMSVADIIGALADLLEGDPEREQPWRATWVPLFANGAGDFLAFDRDSGAIVTYWHDDRARPRHAPDLRTLVDRLVAALEAVEAPRAIYAPPSRLVGKKLARKPSAAQVAKAARGTCYLYATNFVGQPRETVYAKLAPGRWLRVMGGTRKAVVARWQAFAKSPPADDHGCYLTDRDVHFAIQNARDVSMTTVPVA